MDIARLVEEIGSHIQSQPPLRTEDLRDIRRQYTKLLAQAPAQEIIALALRLLKEPGFEHRFMAYELVAYHRPALRSLGEKELEQLGSCLTSWQDVDTFACYLSGPAWREHQVPDMVLERWAASSDRWWRRAAVVSTVALNNQARGGKGDAARTLHICRVLVKDRDDMVVKGLSWALRALSIRDRAAVEAFLQEHEGALAARVVREVRNKLSTGLKNPRRKR